MKKILLAIITIALVATAGVYATRALFSDQEVGGGNTFSTGTIDIAVDGSNPWSIREPLELNDMKPSYTGYMNFTINNVGSNPANIWKTLMNIQYSDETKSEPECIAEGGQWNSESCTGGVEVKNIGSQINYDLRVELYKPDNTEAPVWWETIYQDSDDVKMDTLTGEKAMYLGMIPAGWSMKVIQSYHMISTAGNQYQGDQMTYDVELYAEQLTNTVRLVNKFEADTDVSHHVWNNTYADFNYKVMDTKLNWSLATVGVPDGDYSLIVWDDSSNSYAWNWSTRADAKVLAWISDSGDQTHNGTYDPGVNINNAKVWLVPGHFGTVGGSAGLFPYIATGTFFETGLIDFYDSGL